MTSYGNRVYPCTSITWDHPGEEGKAVHDWTLDRWLQWQMQPYASSTLTAEEETRSKFKSRDIDICNSKTFMGLKTLTVDIILIFGVADPSA